MICLNTWKDIIENRCLLTMCGGSVVRNLSLNFMYRREGARVKLESDPVSLVSALASAESQKGGHPRIVSLSRVSFPFWIVQTSSTKSIVLSATSGLSQQFQFSDLKGSSEIRRIVSSEVSQAADIPVAMSKISPLLERTDLYTAELTNLLNPTPLSSIGKFIVPSDPNAQPNRIEMRIDSGGALKRSEDFKGISETVRLRIEATEALQALFNEKFGGQYSILENLVTLERTRWNDRVKQMEERTEQEIVGLKTSTEDQLYDLREKQKMKLRAMIADFARAGNDLEEHFTQISEEVRNAKTEIGQKEDDVEGAISIYENLASSVRGTIERSNQPIQVMDAKKQELERDAAEARRAYEQEKNDAATALESQIKERQKRIEDTKTEMDEKIRELDELKINANTVIAGAYEAVENKITKFQQEFLNLMSWTLDNNSISELAPLTHLDIHTYVARYDNEMYKILTPHFTTDVGTTSSLGAGPPLSRELDDLFTSSIDEWMKSDRFFNEAFERACIKGNVFLDPEGEKMLTEGLESLARRKILQSSDIERYATLWYRYVGKCPKCSSELDSGAKFCNNCGLEMV